MNTKTRLLRKHITLCFIYSMISAATITMCVLPIHDRFVENVKAQARAEALLEFESTHKERLRSDQAYTNKACTLWWFGMSHEDRTLEVTKKVKRK
jgi:hypothetical protein